MNKIAPEIRMSPSWLRYDPDLDEVVLKLTSELKLRKTRKKEIELTDVEHAHLQRRFKNASQVQSPGVKFVHALAREAGLEDPVSWCKKGNLKEWERAVEKSKADGRHLNDIGRARIYVKTIKQYQAVMRIVTARTKTGDFKKIPHPEAKLIEGSLENYLVSPRSSGFSGFVNFDLLFDLGKGQQGTFEVQIMPWGYEKTDKLSHALYDMIRIIEETPQSFRPQKLKQIKDALILANQALFIEEGERTGFLVLRDDLEDLPQITEAKLKATTEVLDRIFNIFETTGGRNFQWRKDIMEACTYAKTSLLNVYLGQQNQPSRTSKRTRKPA